MNKERILIVEDEVLLAADIEENLTEMGYEVVGLANTSEKAIKYALDMKPDMILMDIHLGGEVDGIETANIIRKEYNCPVVFQTAYAEDPVLKRATESEPYGYLVKPVSIRLLKATIRMALYKAKMDKERDRLRQDLEKALEEIKILRDYLPVCAWCKKVRDDDGQWKDLEEYLSHQTGTTISHSICPDCQKEFMNE